MARILVVDDEAPVRRALARILDGVGHDVVEAADGLEGLEVYGRERPELVVVDMLMPTMDGIEMINRLQRLDENARVICISGGGHSENWGPLAVMDVLGVRGVIMKPFSVDEVITTVRDVLS